MSMYISTEKRGIYVHVDIYWKKEDEYVSMYIFTEQKRKWIYVHVYIYWKKKMKMDWWPSSINKIQLTWPLDTTSPRTSEFFSSCGQSWVTCCSKDWCVCGRSGIWRQQCSRGFWGKIPEEYPGGKRESSAEKGELNIKDGHLSTLQKLHGVLLVNGKINRNMVNPW